MEHFDVLDETGEKISRATRNECHNGSFLLHGVVHVLVFDSTGSLILQKRSMDKDIQPGKWDTSVGGHISCDETLENALYREAEEELGIKGADFKKLYTYIMVSDVERELVNTFRCIWDGPVNFQRSEIDDVRFFTSDEVELNMGKGFFTPNFEEEWGYYKIALKNSINQLSDLL